MSFETGSWGLLLLFLPCADFHHSAFGNDDITVFLCNDMLILILLPLFGTALDVLTIGEIEDNGRVFGSVEDRHGGHFPIPAHVPLFGGFVCFVWCGH